MADEEISYQSATRDVLLSASKVIGEERLLQHVCMYVCMCVVRCPTTTTMKVSVRRTRARVVHAEAARIFCLL